MEGSSKINTALYLFTNLIVITFQIMINDAETRYMDVTIIKSNAENISVLTAGSDGVIRKFMYDIVTDRLELDEESQLCESHAFLKIASCEGRKI